jgi:hypothetical protein
VIHLAVEVEVGKRFLTEFLGLKAEKLRKVVVGADDSAIRGVLEVVLLDVITNALSNISPAYKSSSGLVKEPAKLIRYRDGLLETAVRTGLALGALSLRRLANILNGALDSNLNGRKKLAVLRTKAGILGLHRVNEAHKIRNNSIGLNYLRSKLRGGLRSGGNSGGGGLRSSRILYRGGLNYRGSLLLGGRLASASAA